MSLLKIEEQDYEGNVYHKTTSADIVVAKDTSGLAGTVGGSSNAQNLIDVIADKVANRLLDKGLIANNLVTDNTEMVLAAPMGKVLKEQLDEQNNNINSIPRLNIESNTTITDVANWLFAQFRTGIRPLNIFQSNNIVVFDETGNFNIICTKFIDGDQLTGIAVNHWTRNVFSFGINSDKSWFWKRMATKDDLPIIESYTINPNGSDTVEINLQNNTIVERINVTMASAIDLGILGATIKSAPSKTVTVKLSKAYSSTIRINVLYYEV